MVDCWFFRGARNCLSLLLAACVWAPAVGAHAEPAAPRLNDLIEQNRQGLRWQSPDVYDRYLRTADPGPDGQPGADRTPDGWGGYVFYKGYGGEGACYAVLSAPGRFGNINEIYMGCIYGDILRSWAESGYERRYGYPYTNEFDAERVNAGPGRAQNFLREDGTAWQAIWNSNTGEVVWRRW